MPTPNTVTSTALASGKALLQRLPVPPKCSSSERDRTGFDRHGVLATAELYDPRTGIFIATRRMSVRRAGYTATLLPSAKILIAGGFDGSTRLASVELYDPEARTFTPTGKMSSPRAEHGAAALPDGRVLVTGGSSDGADLLAIAEIYAPTAGTFRRTGT